MYDIDLSMEEELEDFYRDRNRFKRIKHLVDFEFKEKNYKGNSFVMPKPVHKKKLKVSKFIKPNNQDKALF